MMSTVTRVKKVSEAGWAGPAPAVKGTMGDELKKALE